MLLPRGTQDDERDQRFNNITFNSANGIRYFYVIAADQHYRISN